MGDAMVNRSRDLLDIVDVLAKVVAGVFLVVLTFVIPKASERIAAAVDTGRLVQALMSDLTTADQQTRQDLALIALNRSVGNHNSLLVSEIAERIFLDLTKRDSMHHDLGRVAFSVLRSRDSIRASILDDSLSTAADSARTQIVSPPSFDTLAKAAPSPQAQLIARIHPLIAYIQFKNEADRELAENLRKRVEEAGFWAPGVEQVDGEYKDWIRYFHDSDRAVAGRAREIVDRFLQSAGRPREVKLQNLSRHGFRAPEGQVEIWLRLGSK
jgi:hypothetical protein